MRKDEVIGRIKKCGVLPVVRASSRDEALTVAHAIAAGGIDTIELTMTVPGAVEVIASLTAERPELLIGAGTVLGPETARECIAAGARFIVSPSTNFDTIACCSEAGIVVVPGALTPTEIVNAWEAGADIVKVFPADAMGGAKYLRSLKAPLPHIRLIPTGGVDQDTASEFLRAGAEAVGVGADLVDLSAAREGRIDQITAAAGKYLEIVAEARR